MSYISVSCANAGEFNTRPRLGPGSCDQAVGLYWPACVLLLARVHICMYTICVWTYLCTYVCTYVGMYVSMYVCRYVGSVTAGRYVSRWVGRYVYEICGPHASEPTRPGSRRVAFGGSRAQ